METKDILKLIDAGFTKDEILKLIDAGFTKDEILKFDTKPEPEQSEPEKKETEQSEPEKKETEQSEPEKKEPEQPDTLKFIAEQFEKMTKVIQESNIINSDTKLKNDNKSAEQTLADIIAPPERKRGRN